MQLDRNGRKQRREGIEVRHTRGCEGKGARCRCTPSYRAGVWSARDRKLIRSEWFPGDLAAAKAWRDDARAAARKGALRVGSAATVRAGGEQLIEGMRDGTIRTRSGDHYKPSTIRGYEQALRLRVIPELGAVRLTEVRRADIQRLLEQMSGDASTIRNTLLPLRVIFRRAVLRDEVGANPTTGLELPAVRSRRDRVATPSEATALLDALPSAERALWATALYAGLRRGELRALTWENVDLAAGVIEVTRSWDDREGPVEPKSRSGRRKVPIAALLRDHLVEHRMATVRSAGLVFGIDGVRPFQDSTVRKRGRRMWESAGLRSIDLHECRHTFASLMIAAGVNAKALSEYMGHASITITMNRYGHLLPGSENQAAAMLDRFLEEEAATAKGRAAGAENVANV